MNVTPDDSLFIAKLLPVTLDGWRHDGSDEIYTAKKRYEFIDGGAEL